MIIKEQAYHFSDLLLTPKRSTLSSRKDVKLTRLFKFKNNEPSFECIPIIAANMLTGNFKMADSFASNNMMVAIAKHNNAAWSRYTSSDFITKKYIKNCWYTIGMCDDELRVLIDYVNTIKDSIGLEESQQIKVCIDIANGYSQKFADFVRRVKAQLPYNVIMAGNVGTPEMTQELILSGASIVKNGVGSGAQCATRYKTGIGTPNATMTWECADVAHGLGAYVCSDGGLKEPGDFAKAFGCNADFVMAGSIFAGSDESDGKVVTKYEHDGTYNRITIPLRSEVAKFTGNVPEDFQDSYHYEPNIIEKKYKVFYGMSSTKAQEIHFNGIKDYRTSEGFENLVPYTGPVQTTINDILGGLRSACTYIGATEIKYMGKCATFVKCSSIK